MVEDEEFRRPPEEWNKDVEHLVRKIMKVVAGYAATDAIAAMAVVIKRLVDDAHD